MSHYYEKDGRKYPSVTTILKDVTNNSAPLTQWAANMVVEWIRQNCGEHGYYMMDDGDLDAARFHFRDVSQEALDTGSEVHAAIERLMNEILRDS